MHKHLMAVGACTGMMMTALPAQAANCAKRETVVERLQSRYSESLAGGGLQASKDAQALVEVWASEKTGTFTVILTTPEGLACVVATGTDWHQNTLASGVEDAAS